jgi:hypothetical protein
MPGMKAPVPIYRGDVEVIDAGVRPGYCASLVKRGLATIVEQPTTVKA